MGTDKQSGLSKGVISEGCMHLCIDMQRLFAEKTDWHTPWFDRVLPNIVRLANHAPAQSLFTRFIPARRPGEGVGTWRGYYERWSSMTLDRLPPGSIELVEDLARFVPPGHLWDKHVYSPWLEGDLHGCSRCATCRLW